MPKAIGWATTSYCKWSDFIPSSQWLLLQQVSFPLPMWTHAQSRKLCITVPPLVVLFDLFGIVLAAASPPWKTSLLVPQQRMREAVKAQHRLNIVPYSAYTVKHLSSSHVISHIMPGFEAVSEVYLLKRLSGTKTRTAEFNVNMDPFACYGLRRFGEPFQPLWT